MIEEVISGEKSYKRREKRIRVMNLGNRQAREVILLPVTRMFLVEHSFESSTFKYVM